MTRARKTQLRSLFGKGSYTVPEVARLLRLPAAKVRRWVGGYSFRKDGAPRFSEPVIRRELENDLGLIELSFLDLIEVLFVSNFHAQGVSLQVIRKTAERASQMFGTDHPFCVQKFKTDGRSIFADMQRDEAALRARGRSDHTIDLRSGQQVFQEVFAPYFKAFTYDVDSDLVREWFPLGMRRAVVLNPTLSFGEPVVRDFGVPTRALKLAASSGQAPTAIADWYALPVEAIRDALEFEGQLQAAA